MAIVPGEHCYSCLKKMAVDVLGMVSAAPGGNPDLEEAVEAVLRRGLACKWPPPRIAAHILDRIRVHTGVADPYADTKKRELELAERLFHRIRPLFDTSFRSAVWLAALGNSLDYFKEPEQALEEIRVSDPSTLRFERDHIDPALERLAASRMQVLYLTDNAGEIHFDLPLIEHLKKMGHRLILAPKGGPALNDLTDEDLRRYGPVHAVPEIVSTGAAAPGVDLERSSPEFLRVLRSSDFIVSKGMANLETLYPAPGSQPVLYIFKVKCVTVSRYLDAPLHAYCALLQTECA